MLYVTALPTGSYIYIHLFRRHVHPNEAEYNSKCGAEQLRVKDPVFYEQQGTHGTHGSSCGCVATAMLPSKLFILLRKKNPP